VRTDPGEDAGDAVPGVGFVATGADGADGFDQQAAATKTSVGRATSKRIRAIGIVLKSILEGNCTSEGMGDRVNSLS
jgi:hypothetical protein